MLTKKAKRPEIFLIVLIGLPLLCPMMPEVHSSPGSNESTSKVIQKEGDVYPSYKLPPGFDEKLVFQSDIDGDYEIFLLTKQGINKLTDNSYPDEYPLFSPDGRKVLYEAKPQKEWKLFVLDIDSGTIEKVIDKKGNFMHPCWAPDGEVIAFDTDFWGGKEIGTFDLKKGTITRLTDTIGENILPAWSPDGKTLAFSGHRLLGWKIYVMDLSTLESEDITGRGNCRPDWSPDGSQITYVSNNGKKYDVFLMRPDGKDKRALAAEPDRVEYDPCWSRDGKRVFYHKSSEDKEPPFHIWFIRANGSDPFQITLGDSDERYPDAY